MSKNEVRFNFDLFFLLIGRSIKQSLQAKVNKINMKDQTDTLPHKDRGTKKTNAAKTRVTTPHSFERIKGSKSLSLALLNFLRKIGSCEYWK